MTEEDTNSLWGEGPAAISHFSLSSEGRLQTTGKGEKKKRLLCRFGGGGTRFSLAIFKRYVIEWENLAARGAARVVITNILSSSRSVTHTKESALEKPRLGK